MNNLSDYEIELVKELCKTNNPSELLNTKFSALESNGKKKLCFSISVLVNNEYIKVKWADNEPYFVEVLGKSYNLVDSLEGKQVDMSSERSIIFISHKSTDKEVADMLKDFLVNIGIPSELIFCSSLPGNDVKENIPVEVKDKLKHSIVNIMILSQEYYNSAYCLNELGVIWYFNDVSSIAIGLPEIEPRNMVGFYDRTNILRRLDVDTDIATIVDIVTKKTNHSVTNSTTLINESNKLIKKYGEYISKRGKQSNQQLKFDKITTDDELILLYYILKNKTIKVNKTKFLSWINQNEIKNINVENAFYLFSSKGKLEGDEIELSRETFRLITSVGLDAFPECVECVKKHTILASDKFIEIEDKLDDIQVLFTGYLIDQSKSTLGSRWKANEEIDSIKKWESFNDLTADLSLNYDKCLNFFIDNELVYPCSWTSENNVREYALYPSIKKYLSNKPKELMEKIKKEKEEHNLSSIFYLKTN